MLSSQGFDLWADGYDRSVGLTDEEGGYPFAGYKELLNRIYQRVLTRKSPRVLDIGFGTGTLAARLYQQGCVIFGQDFSARMLEVASAKMPQAQLYQGDFSRGLVPQLQGQTFDFITATYSLHHLTLEGKRDFLAQLRRQLAPEGEILIGDVAFRTQTELEACRKAAGPAWDEEEIYFVLDELLPFFPHLRYEKISDCAALMTLKKD